LEELANLMPNMLQGEEIVKRSTKGKEASWFWRPSQSAERPAEKGKIKSAGLEQWIEYHCDKSLARTRQSLFYEIS
jgi:hypothetical protein